MIIRFLIRIQLITGAVCFCLCIKYIFSKLYIVVEVIVSKLERLLNNDRYIKFFMISSYVLLGIMVLAKILGVKAD